MSTRQPPWLTGLAATVLLSLVSGCTTPPRDDKPHLAAFTTRLAATNAVPPVNSPATGTVDAVLDTQTRLLRWKMTFRQLSGPATMAHFHGPAAVGANAGVALGFAAPVNSPYEGRATLTPQQAADLLAGKWYVNVHTARFPAGEVRGQMIERK